MDTRKPPGPLSAYALHGFPGGQPSQQQHPVEGQSPNYGIPPYTPIIQADQFVANNPAPSQQFENFSVTVFDARPLNTIDFNTFLGTNPLDTIPTPVAPLNVVSIFYNVPAGRVAILRKWSMNLTPADDSETSAIITPQGTTNFWSRVSFLIDGIPQDQEANLIFGDAPFGEFSGECYIIAGANAVIEMRVQGLGSDPTVIDNDAVFQGALMRLYGNVLRQTGREFTQEPLTTASIPVRGGVNGQ